MKIGSLRMDAIPCQFCDDPVPIGDWELHLEAEHDIEFGERIAESPVTGERYRVTAWKDKGDGKMVAFEKEPLEDEQ